MIDIKPEIPKNRYVFLEIRFTTENPGKGGIWSSRAANARQPQPFSGRARDTEKANLVISL